MKRPKNSALEVDLDFEHNVRPPPVITEEVTATLEEMIQKRILEVYFSLKKKKLKIDCFYSLNEQFLMFLMLLFVHMFLKFCLVNTIGFSSYLIVVYLLNKERAS